MSEIESRGYKHPESLVSTAWVAEHLNDPMRIVESNEDPLLYPTGHVPGAVEVDWTRDLNDPVRRDYLGREGFETLVRRLGVTKDTTVIFYGDRNNWWATYALWVFRLFGHNKAKIMDGGRIKWTKEGRPLTREVPSYPPSDYKAPSATTRPGAPSATRCSSTSRQEAADRRAQPAGVQRRAAPHAGLPERGGAARRPHPGRGEHPLGARRRSRRRHLQDRRRPARPLRGRGEAQARRTTSSSTAGSASAAATPGSCSPTCWATSRYATMMGAGPSGGTSWASPSSAEAPGVI